ncbi:MAG: alkaline phosphatase D family protein [Cyclobacteriaceae bacterium]|nr:alkaline phosphatase D family protein [Cyclobacteriaceae bacterium]MDH4295323.1 alkaline phosphatase D family protein [Cyclobacteriaceae bacterium]MDH5250446.1 alkaline phosphatase D family protein [Cyclobacteriaceae bacterium]
MIKLIVIVVPLMVYQVSFSQSVQNEKVYFTAGFKIGEITNSSAIVLTRLCKSPKPNPVIHDRNPPPFRAPKDFDDTMPVNQMDGAVEGVMGQVSIELYSTTDTIATGWNYVSSYKDYTIKTTFESLRPDTEYRIVLLGRKTENSPITSIAGQFRTAPNPQQIKPVLFTSSTCQYFWDFDDSVRGFKIYDRMLELNPDFHCQTGDYVYYDKPGPMAYTIAKARHKWTAINAWPSLVDFYARTPLFIQKDDHDITKDDVTPFSQPFGELSFQDGLAIWYEQTPTIENKPYRSSRYGMDLEIWFVEGREFRNANNADTPNKTIWGDEQKEWFVESVKNSNATFKILMSPTPVVGPDRESKKDNHANNAYEKESVWLKDFIASQKNMFIVNGDRHWQYVSKDVRTGVLEFSQGPSSDEHAQGWKPEDVRPEHEFLRVKGGFLAVRVDRINNHPIITFTHYDVNGNVVNNKIIADK